VSNCCRVARFTHQPTRIASIQQILRRLEETGVSINYPTKTNNESCQTINTSGPAGTHGTSRNIFQVYQLISLSRP
jgi:hypothetical protein